MRFRRSVSLEYSTWFVSLGGTSAQRQFIYSLEALGITSPYFCPALQPFLENRDCIHFGDNQASNGAHRKGYTKSEDVAMLVVNFHLRIAALNIRRWIEYVHTDEI